MRRLIAISLFLTGLIAGQVNYIGAGEGGLQKESEERQERENLNRLFQDHFTIISQYKMIEDWKRVMEKNEWESKMMHSCIHAAHFPNYLAILCNDFLDSFREEMPPEGQR